MIKKCERFLVLASKYVGFETVRYLLRIKAPVDRVVVANDTDPYNRKIISLLQKNRIRADMYNIGTQESLAKEHTSYEWLLNLWSPYILRPPVLSLAQHRLNIHSGLVPICQGNDNAAWCIRMGLPAGVSLLDMNSDVDRGGVYAQKKVAYTFPTTGKTLHARLQKAAVKLFQDNWEHIYSGSLTPTRQKGKSNYFTRKQTEIDRVRSETDLMTIKDWVDWVLAHDFHPGTTAEVKYNNATYRLRLKVEKHIKA